MSLFALPVAGMQQGDFGVQGVLVFVGLAEGWVACALQWIMAPLPEICDIIYIFRVFIWSQIGKGIPGDLISDREPGTSNLITIRSTIRKGSKNLWTRACFLANACIVLKIKNVHMLIWQGTIATHVLIWRHECNDKFIC